MIKVDVFITENCLSALNALNNCFVLAVMIFYNESNEENKFCKTTRVCFIVSNSGASERFTNTMMM